MSDTNKYLKSARLKAGKTQKWLANRLNVSQTAVALWEKGVREPSIDTLFQIADLLNTPIAYLIDGENELTKTDENINEILQKISSDDLNQTELSEYVKVLENLIKKEALIEAELHNTEFKTDCPNKDNILLSAYHKLNYTGQEKAIEQVEMLTKIPEYQADRDD